MRISILIALLIPSVLSSELVELLMNTVLRRGLQTTCNLCALPPDSIPIASGVPRTVDGCCAGNFQGCGTGNARCRTLATYAIQPALTAAAINDEVCPTTPEPGCNCQLGLSEGINVSMKLCPNPKQCCANCRCIGDPHCLSFAGQADSWVVCDIRNGDCSLPTGTAATKMCSEQTYEGARCVTRPDLTGHKFCQYPLSKPPPTMDMYERSYVSATTGLTQIFNVTLQIGVFGSTDTITILDGGNAYKFGFSFKKGVLRCVVPPNLSVIASGTLSAGGFLVLDKLDSGVLMQLQCVVLKHMWGTRWDILTLEDDFIPNAPDRAGFCQTGIIPQSVGTPQNSCNLDRILLAQFQHWGYYCEGSITFQTPSPTIGSNASDAGGVSDTLCKQNWCSKPLLHTGTGINWEAANFSSLSTCRDFVSIPGDNFLRAVCALAPGVTVSNPAVCDEDENCSNCMSDLKDFPQELATILQPASVTVAPHSAGATPAPTVSCDPTSLLTLGLQNAALGAPLVTGGIQILFQAEGDANQTVIWLATDAEIAQFTASCGCIDFLSNTQLIIFTTTGNYTIQQCFPENQFLTGHCSAAPTYLVDVDYPTLPTGTDFSIPFGTLVAVSGLVCSNSTECPPNSQCCIWNFQGPGWQNCMGSLAKQYPNCGKSISCPGCP